jgi:hypothetical protein
MAKAARGGKASETDFVDEVVEEFVNVPHLPPAPRR